MNNQNMVCGLFLDIKKAFDTVNQAIQSYKSYTVFVVFLIWFTSYLTDRQQHVKINDVLSSVGRIKHKISSARFCLKGCPLYSLYKLIYVELI